MKENDFVQAAKVIGNKPSRIIYKHILPNVISVIVVRATLGISTAVLDTAALGFLGLGVQPPFAEWGDMLGRARGFIFTAKVMNRMLLEVKNLTTEFRLKRGVVKAVNNISINIDKGEILAIVGESGSGKSVTSLSIMGLLQKPGRIAEGEILFKPRDITLDLNRLSGKELQKIRGHKISMIFQEPMTSLNPVKRIKDQIMEIMLAHLKISKKEAYQRSIAMLETVGIPSAAQRAYDFPHQMSGGMRQRVMIAMALACEPELLIADEPTTALDVTIQAQILELLCRLREQFKMAVLLITHDLGVVSETADRVIVMYCGKIMEESDVRTLFKNPLHPYTKGLLRSIPQLDDEENKRLYMIKGMVPNPLKMPQGCPFSDRCDHSTKRCAGEMPELLNIAGHQVRCFLYENTDQGGKNAR